MSTLANSSTWAVGLTAVQPMHGGYDAARRGFNLHADLRPAAVITARSVADVQTAVRLAADRGLRIAPFGTGHLAPALPDLHDAILLRTELGHEVDVDPIARRARIPAGAVWEDVVNAVAPFGLAAPHGSSPNVGVMGYLLGGGLSFYARQHGLANNYVAAFEVVCADGEVRHVDEHNFSNLFWALRGGGGNYGIVTAVVIDLLPYSEVYAGAMFWPIAEAPTVLRAWNAWTRDAPASVSTAARLMRLPALDAVPEPLREVPVVAIDGVAVDEADGLALTAMLRSVATPMIDGFQRMPSAMVLRVHGDPEDPVAGVAEHTLLGDLDDGAIDALLAVAGADAPADYPLLVIELRQLGGAIGVAPAGAGARGSLDGSFALFGAGLLMDPSALPPIESALVEMRTAMAPWDTGGAYLNFEERGDSARRFFDPETYERLVAVRGEWDPARRLVASHAITEAA